MLGVTRKLLAVYCGDMTADSRERAKPVRSLAQWSDMSVRPGSINISVAEVILRSRRVITHRESRPCAARHPRPVPR